MVNGLMKKRNKSETFVMGVNATAPRPTLIGALYVFCVLAVPVFCGLSLLDWLF